LFGSVRCFVAAGNGNLNHVTGMDSLKYQAILAKSVMPSACNLKVGLSSKTMIPSLHPSLPEHGSGIGQGMSLSGRFSL